MNLILNIIIGSIIAALSGFSGYQLALYSRDFDCDIQRINIVTKTPKAFKKTPETVDQWFPNNNKVDWQIRMPPNAQTGVLRFHDESQEENHIIHITAERRTGNLPIAWLALQYGQEAGIKLPQGRYNITIKSWSRTVKYAETKPVTFQYPQSIPIEIGQTRIVSFYGQKSAFLQPATKQNQNKETTLSPEN